MDERITNLIRYFIDMFIPAIIRDNRILMYPLFRYWFKERSMAEFIMDYKERVHSLSEEEFGHFMVEFESRGSSRNTDSSFESMDWVMQRIHKQSKTLLDVGCGKGTWLAQCSGLGMELTGCDIFKADNFKFAKYRQGNIEALPFSDDSFDVVTCFFTLEHVRHLQQALNELKRVTRRQLFIAVPCQRYFKYTFDTHVHFFYSPTYFQSLVGIPKSEYALVGPRRIEHILYYGEVDGNTDWLKPFL